VLRLERVDAFVGIALERAETSEGDVTGAVEQNDAIAAVGQGGFLFLPRRSIPDLIAERRTGIVDVGTAGACSTGAALVGVVESAIVTSVLTPSSEGRSRAIPL